MYTKYDRHLSYRKGKKENLSPLQGSNQGPQDETIVFPLQSCALPTELRRVYPLLCSSSLVLRMLTI